MRRECTDLAEAARRAAADWRLGLFIARELVRAMGGEIEATGAPRPGLDLHRPPALGPAARQPLCRCF
jgi:hypothetical protein